MKEQMRYFLLDDTHILALPPSAGGSLFVWVHDADGMIRSDYLQSPESLTSLTEVTEEEARRLDPGMFDTCLDRPYYESLSLIAFYQMRYEEACEELAAIEQEEEAQTREE